MSKTVEVRYVGTDYWSRPSFVDKVGNYFCSIDNLYTHEEWFNLPKEKKQQVVENLHYQGKDQDNDPMFKVSKESHKLTLVFTFSDTSIGQSTKGY